MRLKARATALTRFFPALQSRYLIRHSVCLSGWLLAHSKHGKGFTWDEILFQLLSKLHSGARLTSLTMTMVWLRAIDAEADTSTAVGKICQRPMCLVQEQASSASIGSQIDEWRKYREDIYVKNASVLRFRGLSFLDFLATWGGGWCTEYGALIKPPVSCLPFSSVGTLQSSSQPSKRMALRTLYMKTQK